tara:strand:+ start:75 stop:215 length:141 start_codon:yes stop_codon:yes gene_type:complete
MRKIAVLFPLISIGNEVIALAEKELKVCNSYFSNSNKEYTGTYIDD